MPEGINEYASAEVGNFGRDKPHGADDHEDQAQLPKLLRGKYAAVQQANGYLGHEASHVEKRVSDEEGLKEDALDIRQNVTPWCRSHLKIVLHSVKLVK
jgi:hypothetical protein